MPKIIDLIYRPFLYARYSMFQKAKESGRDDFTYEEEYKMLHFFNYMTPMWPEAALILLLGEFINLPFNVRLILMAIIFVLTLIISKIFINRLKKRSYIEKVTDDYVRNDIGSSSYRSMWFCFMVVSLYAIVPLIPIVFFYIIFQSK